jgi:hypothetical protein
MVFTSTHSGIRSGGTVLWLLVCCQLKTADSRRRRARNAPLIRPPGTFSPRRRVFLSSLTRMVQGSRFEVRGFEFEAFSFRLDCILRITYTVQRPLSFSFLARKPPGFKPQAENCKLPTPGAAGEVTLGSLTSPGEGCFKSPLQGERVAGGRVRGSLKQQAGRLQTPNCRLPTDDCQH